MYNAITGVPQGSMPRLLLFLPVTMNILAEIAKG
jgi:hypothetical protein